MVMMVMVVMVVMVMVGRWMVRWMVMTVMLMMVLVILLQRLAITIYDKVSRQIFDISGDPRAFLNPFIEPWWCRVPKIMRFIFLSKNVFIWLALC